MQCQFTWHKSAFVVTIIFVIVVDDDDDDDIQDIETEE